MSLDDAFEALGWGHHDWPEELAVKKRHRELLLKYHPDKAPKDLQEAYTNAASTLNKAKEVVMRAYRLHEQEPQPLSPRASQEPCPSAPRPESPSPSPLDYPSSRPQAPEPRSTSKPEPFNTSDRRSQPVAFPDPSPPVPRPSRSSGPKGSGQSTSQNQQASKHTLKNPSATLEAIKLESKVLGVEGARRQSGEKAKGLGSGGQGAKGLRAEEVKGEAVQGLNGDAWTPKPSAPRPLSPAALQKASSPKDTSNPSVPKPSFPQTFSPSVRNSPDPQRPPVSQTPSDLQTPSTSVSQVLHSEGHPSTASQTPKQSATPAPPLLSDSAKHEGSLQQLRNFFEDCVAEPLGSPRHQKSPGQSPSLRGAEPPNPQLLSPSAHKTPNLPTAEGLRLEESKAERAKVAKADGAKGLAAETVQSANVGVEDAETVDEWGENFKAQGLKPKADGGPSLNTEGKGFSRLDPSDEGEEEEYDYVTKMSVVPPWSELSSHIRLLAQIGDGDKLRVTGDMVSIDSAGLIGSVSRWLSSQGRNPTILWLTRFAENIHKFSEGLKTGIATSGEDCRHHGPMSRGELVECLSKELGPCIEGLRRLKGTYADDRPIISRLDSVLGSLEKSRTLVQRLRGRKAELARFKS
eukprot:CAMPEP_0184326050 /NCGR_PEP_ID=MMETSP1049-20130417/142356_1 /TAXON_ID=77928 /ORGANISM="Proteomonas sulcata, Strain CCMP704" /LENGTH=632 /DNA_ID=CAMNT_0026648219 /DNA_START=28 /DNA_END=1926 /DNA_ORIENTATION=+